jgi:2-dehydro-3-deoxyphosphogluconate aldolase/(4S)-4-hydroxy-2-oxoglutarate aldolase
MKAQQVYETIRREKIIVIARPGGARRSRVRGVKKDDIIGIAEAVLKAGITLFEVACNTDGVFEMIRLLNKKMSDPSTSSGLNKMIIGAGTVITTDLCKKAIEAGAKYIIAPDVNPDVIDFCVKRDIAVLPGAATATEILTAKRYGAKMVKIFPAFAIGIDYIKALRDPIDDVAFVAVGGVRPENIKDFFAAGCIAIGIGSSVVRKEFVAKRDWKAITETAQQYVKNLPR